MAEGKGRKGAEEACIARVTPPSAPFPLFSSSDGCNQETVLSCFQWCQGVEVASGVGSERGLKHQAPTSKHQRNSKPQPPTSKESPNQKLQRPRERCLVIGAWMFFGAWGLEFGASVRNGSTENSEEPF